MFIYYNVIWIICLILLFLSLFVIFKRRRRANTIPAGTYPENFVVVDVNGIPLHNQPTQPATYAPPPPTQSSAFTTYRPADSSVNPPPPSYQDYSKDYRVQPTH